MRWRRAGRRADPAGARLTTEELVAAARDRSARALGRLLSLAEDGADDYEKALALLGSSSSRAHVVGLTGAPGVGKSTTTAALVRACRATGRRVAVLAVDPSSRVSGGALLGDRVRMVEHDLDEDVFVRSMASRGHLGGLSQAAPRVMELLAVAGFDVVLVETVGVGQSEVEIADRADTTVVLVAPGMGDGIQAAKAGILEVADILVVNKADRDGAARTARELRQATPGVPVLQISATTGTGIDELLEAIDARRPLGDRGGGADPSGG